MKDWFCKAFTPWRAAALFEDGDAWFAYLVRYDKVCNAIRVVLFAVAVFLSFSTGTSWGTFAILVPIATGMFAAGTNLEMMIISVSAVLAGAVCGDHISPISDTTVMSSAGAQSNHLNHVSTQMQYAAVTACVCLVGYLIAAVTRTWWITLGVSLLLLLAVLTGMRRFCAKKAENGKK